MTQNKRYVFMLHSKCKDIPREELQSMADQIDPDIGMMLFYSFMNQASFEVVEKHAATNGDVVPVSRRNFYRKRKRYIQDIEQRLALSQV